ncbi:hypothetical protein [Cohnella luojiensis]|uniref:Uncharacterized protein n=1 Tax=Cohnella luojiensis TaxID=652876 RepID=A0A4Y8M1F5_9BACL|nr:hypothetical protein [Cohnella luojiensis]TFE26329.1 hypothetical protein E2980_12010 [Cohnella luojiensis]
MKRGSRELAAVIAMIMLSLLLNRPLHSHAAEKPVKSVISLTVRSSLNANSMSRLDINSPRISKALLHAKKEAGAKASLWVDMNVTIKSGSKEQQFQIDRSGNLWEVLSEKRLILPAAVTSKLSAYAMALRTQHFGSLIPWEQARDIVTRKSIFSVTDLETGLSFRVQRRAGSSHADVQPITKDDTAVMKQIYGDQWSWNRRAITVHSPQGRLAASMNGMPHGGDGIPENGFSGHFCIHFKDSTSHKSDTPDPAHQLMIRKASGDVRSYLDSAEPSLLAESFVEALNQKDPQLLAQVWEDIPDDKLSHFVREMITLSSIRIKRSSKSQTTDDNIPLDNVILETEITLPIAIYSQGKPERNTVYGFIFRWQSPRSPWEIEDIRTDYSSLMP